VKQEHVSGDAIVIRGARQNNLKNLSLAIPTGELVVVTGVSGSGKSSLVFDTLYAEGQRRYVETFSPYARQFLDRMDKPQVDAVEGIPPAIAIDQTNPVRTSRSTVGTMTELNDHLKLLFARGAKLFCRGCGKPVVRDTPGSVFEALLSKGPLKVVVTFPIPIPKNFTEKEIEAHLQAQGYTKLHSRSKTLIEVIQDRVVVEEANRSRLTEALETALKFGQGKVNVYGEKGEVFRYSSDLHCPDCDIHYAEPTPAAFSFNSPLGACDACRGFGRVIGVDFGLVGPDEAKTLKEGAVRPWQTASFKECQDDLEKYAKKRKIALDTPWRDLSEKEKNWVLEGEPEWVSWRKSWPGVWYGVRRFFKWLESKAYKMHIRVLLSKYRAYTECVACLGTRLKPDAVLWKIEGKSIHDLVLLPISSVKDFFESQKNEDEATDLLLTEIRARLRFLSEVGLGYLTLDRQSRTLSGGEVQRINLTTALGTSLVNTLFVLDEPSIGLHPRDMGRVIDVMKRLRDAGNSLVVVEHDPQIMFAADRILDMGPGPGERGGDIVFFGPPGQLQKSDTLTADLPVRPQGGGRSAQARTAAPVHRAARRLRAQPEEHRRALPARAAGLRDRRVGVGQVDAGAGRALRGAAQGERPADRDAGRASRAERRRESEQRGARRPVADRQDHALQSGELRRRF
jgi:excinuclease ABC subunit A